MDDTIGDDALPRQFGKYTLLSRLSAGGMAELFLALSRATLGFERLVVIKQILPAKNRDRAFIDMLLHEARVAATLSHPNIVQTFDAGEVDGTHFIAMEHIHGEDVHAIMRAVKVRGTVAPPLEVAIGAVTGVLRGLVYVHEKRDIRGVPLGIVHRDISTRNIVVSFSGDVKIVDFGVAKSDIDDGEDPSERELKGKVRYMSPEQAAGSVVDHRTDIFAAGVVLFEMTTGQRLFKAASDVEALLLVRNGEYTRPSQVVPDYPPALEGIVVRALQKDRDDRYSSAREMLEDLERFAHDEEVETTPPRLAAWMQSLFEDKLARHKRTLLGVRKLVDTVSTRDFEPLSGTTPTTMSTLATGAAPSTTTVAPPAPRAGAGPTIAIASATASALTVAFGFVYMQHEMSLRQAELMNMYREEQALRQQTTLPPVEAKGALEIASKPPGCAIWLNGVLRTELAPAKIDRLPLDRELHVKLVKDGFETFRTIVKLHDDAPFKEVVAEMKRTPASLLLQLDPPAGVWVDGKAWKGDRTKIEGLSPDEEHRIVIAANGYLPKVVNVVVPPGETKTLRIRLIKADAARDESAPPPPPARASASAPL